MTFKPFADDVSTLAASDVTLENGTDRVVVPSFEVTRDREGLDRAESVMSALKRVADALRADPHLPQSVGAAATDAPVEVPNPFASKG